MTFSHDAPPVGGLVVDCFSGPGGWDVGAAVLGLRPVGFEWDASACRTGKAAGHIRVQADVSQVPLGPMAGKVSGLVQSPPCQSFSQSGDGAGRDALPELLDGAVRVWRGSAPREVCPPDLDPRSVLVLEPVRWARDLRPEWIALEQVPAVAPIWHLFVQLLRRDGYSAWSGVVNAADFGVPQTRKRAVLVASRVRTVSCPERTHCQGGSGEDLFGPGLPAWRSIAEALGLGAGARPLPDRSDGRWVQRRLLGKGMVERYGEAKPRGIDEPSYTLRANATSGTPGYEIQFVPDDPASAGEQPIRITAREAALLQTFPDGYPWAGSPSKWFEQIGNAVPPLLAAHVLSAATGIAVPPGALVPKSLSPVG